MSEDGDDHGGEDGTAGGGDRADPDAPRIALAQGTFDIVHPGHLHYLEDAAARGDELHVIVARRENVTHKPKPVCPDRQRRDVVAALEVVDEAHLGHPEDFFVPVRAIDPDVIVLGFDQHHDETAIAEALAAEGIDAEVARASGREPRYEGELLSTGEIIDRLLEQRG
ncbi:adenylyltransferase/cytidyltransferase family protein [Halobaculum sp. EA56]|uniref:adenylyltransferase/cytidyltransferase family protein n=1 Tax=Halobaculum sp. EA56 TaxID=3421648 RepID=UPI003EB6E0E2